MRLHRKTQIIFIDDDIDPRTYPLAGMVVDEYGDENVQFFQEPQKGIDYIKKNLDKKSIVILDIMFGGQPTGLNVFDEIIKESALVCFILMTGNMERVERSKLIDLINGHAWYLVKRDSPLKEIMDIIKKANHYMSTRVDSALEEWILNHSPQEIDRPYLTTTNGETYKLIDILKAIREGHNNEFGQEMINGILNLTIDLLARNDEQIK
jgi:DNA-binding NarL/FixJ family response regulator